MKGNWTYGMNVLLVTCTVCMVGFMAAIPCAGEEETGASVITGVAVDHSSTKPVSGIRVLLARREIDRRVCRVAPEFSAVTDDKGRFAIKAPPGRYVVCYALSAESLRVWQGLKIDYSSVHINHIAHSLWGTLSVLKGSRYGISDDGQLVLPFEGWIYCSELNLVLITREGNLLEVDTETGGDPREVSLPVSTDVEKPAFRILSVEPTTEAQEVYGIVPSGQQAGSVSKEKIRPEGKDSLFLITEIALASGEADLDRDIMLVGGDGSKTRVDYVWDISAKPHGRWVTADADSFGKAVDAKKPQAKVMYRVTTSQMSGSRIRFAGDDHPLEPWVVYYISRRDGVEWLRPAPGATIGRRPDSTKSPLPPFGKELQGTNEIRVRNPNDFSVTAGVRKEKKGKDWVIPPRDTASAFVPDGRYEIYFVYSDKPDALFQGDGFTLSGNGVEIQIVKLVGGNYGIKRVK